MYKYLANTLFTAKKLIYLPTCHSTNDLARQFIMQKEVLEGTLIITDAQTAGKGQRGNKWLSEPGKNLTFSVIYKPHFLKAEESFSLNVVVSLSIINALAKMGVSTSIKWPNDIYHDKQKVGGILIENTIDRLYLKYAIIGIGLNVNQENFDLPSATSLVKITDKKFELPLVLENLCISLEQHYIMLKSGRIAQLRNMYYDHLLGLNTSRRFNIEGQVVEGMIQGIDLEGRLKVEIAGKMQYFSFKEISFIMD